jgi:argininosuccinate lyase
MNAHQDVSIRERVKQPPAPAILESYFNPALTRALAHHFELENWIHLAHAQMLVRQQIIGAEDGAKIQGCVLALNEAGPDALKIDHALEDLYSYVERHITRTLGPEAGGRLHTGRSRNDLHVTTWRMTLRGQMQDVLDALVALRRRVLALAETHAATIMPGFTHWQHAQPVTFGYYLLAFADQLERDFSRCLAAYQRTNRNPLGAGALTTTAFPLDRAFTTEALGFDGLMEIAYDAVSSRDDAHEAASAFAILMTAISRLAIDLQAWSTLEYRYIELGDQHCSVSSIMPQKKNPACLENLKAAAAMVTGNLTAALACSKNTAFADVSDGVTAVSDPVTDAAVTTRRALVLLEDVLGAITVNAEHMRHMTEIGFGTATELADVIVRETGLSFRMAHNIVAVVVAEAIEAGLPATAIKAADLERAAQTLFKRGLGISAAAVHAALDPGENVSRRTVAGGPSAANMRSMIAERGVRLAEDGTTAVRLRAQVATARKTSFDRARTQAA